MFVPDKRDVENLIARATPWTSPDTVTVPLLADIRRIVTTVGIPVDLLESAAEVEPAAAPPAPVEQPKPKQPSKSIEDIHADLRKAQGLTGPTTGPIKATVQRHYLPVSYNDYDAYEAQPNAGPLMFGFNQPNSDESESEAEMDDDE